MLKRFLNPRWQHPDPEVRRAAVAALRCGADADAIAQVAREDVLPALRRLVIRQCRDLDLLLEIEEKDTDETVCKEAAQHYRQVLAGLVDDGPSLSERLDRAARVDHVQLIEFLAREGKDDALREQALARVEREAVLRDVALKDPNRELRLKALDRIQDENVLTRIYEQSRTSDKLISRRVRERLEANKAQRERPRQVSAQCVQICTTVESLGGDGAWNRDEARLVDLDSRWHSLEEPYRKDYELRFQSARQRFCATIAENRRAEPAIRAAAEALIARLQGAHGTLILSDENLTSQADELEALHREVLAAWPLIDRLPDAQEEQEVAIRFTVATQAVQASTAQLRQRLQLTDLCARFDRLAARKGVIAESEVKALEHEQGALPKSPLADDDSDGLSALQPRIDKAHRRLRERLREQATWKEETLAGLAARLDHLQAAVTDGQAREAIAEHDSVTADVEALCTIGASKERTTAAQARLRSLAKDVQVMRAWSKFGAARALQSLCEEMEALKASAEQPLEIARKVRAARETWKERSSNGRGADQKLWKRFDAAATEAYLPCKAFFKEQAKQRKANLERRRQVLQKLEALLGADIGGPKQDWKMLVRTRTELLAEWHHAHPVERSNAKAMGERFDAQIAALDVALERERERCV
ncbi:MAG: exonuclease SbcC, partial [Gammaproteobacteria bacterium]